MKKLYFILFVFFLAVRCQAQSTNVNTIMVQTILSIPTDGQTNFIATSATNGLAFIWKNSPSAPNHVQIGGSTNACMMNALYWVISHGPPGGWIGRGMSNSGSFYVITAGPSTNVASSGYSMVSYYTNAIQPLNVPGNLNVMADAYINGPNGLQVAGVGIFTNGILSLAPIYGPITISAFTMVVTNKLFVDGGALLAGLTITNGTTNVNISVSSNMVSTTALTAQGGIYGHTVTTNGNYTSLVTDDLIVEIGITNSTITITANPNQILKLLIRGTGTNYSLLGSGGGAAFYINNTTNVNPTLTNSLYRLQADSTGTNWNFY